ncbi:unnamed protein product [Haemonchus placei]|uniref:Uncharacterized protein n=1 Tax=Haemonchus placei TaxID=6290 RepID=A0A0N4W5W2_HAEPC|nr:unnamed protein product [Haemonchus placei]
MSLKVAWGVVFPIRLIMKFVWKIVEMNITEDPMEKLKKAFSVTAQTSTSATAPSAPKQTSQPKPPVPPKRPNPTTTPVATTASKLDNTSKHKKD